MLSLDHRGKPSIDGADSSVIPVTDEISPDDRPEFIRGHFFCIIGGGNFGRALTNYSNFERRGFMIQALFDTSEEKIGKMVRGIPTLDMKDLEAYLASHNIEIAVLTIPKQAAQEVADRLIACGIKAIWNFAHLDLKVPEDVVVENVHLSESLMQLSYRISEKRDNK